MNFIKKQELYIKKVINEIGYEVEDVVLNKSSRPEFGEYQYNGAMNLAKIYHKNPKIIADEIVEKLKENKDYININVQGAGFINISFSNEALIAYLNIIKDNIKINMNTYEKKKIFFDYGGANVAKVLHVGHLRSANIGEALKRLCNLIGYDTISDAHLGDFGRPLGLVILEIKKRMPDLVYFDENYKGEYPNECPVTNDDLLEIYPYASNQAKKDEKYLEEARVITNEFQNGNNRGYCALLKQIVNVSVKEIKKIYLELNTTFDLWEGESDCYKYFEEMLAFLKEKNVLVKSQGATVIEVKEKNENKPMPPLMVIRSNGSVAYESTDLAGIWERKKLYNPDEIWYFTDMRQTLHFEQLFRAAYKSGIVNTKTKLYYGGFGTMNGTDGKPFKTRDGGVMTLSNLLSIVKEEVDKITRSDIIDDRDKVVEDIAIAALKYADLSPDVKNDYIFDLSKFCSMNGKTGPYLLYSTIRIKSLLNKADIINYKICDVYNEFDKNIILIILEMPKVIDNSLNNKTLSFICDYLYRLSNVYNNFYNSNKILTESDEKKKHSWITLSYIVYQINTLLLDVLSINIPKKM